MLYNERFTTQVTWSVLEIRSPHFYTPALASLGRTKKIGLRIYYLLTEFAFRTVRY